MKRILVVDDKKNVLNSIGIGLRREGYQVDMAGNALEAIEKMGKKSYDIMLSDLKMPKTNGIELANKVAVLYPKVRTILMSAYDFKDYEEKYVELRQYPKINKPFEMAELLEIFDNWDLSPILQDEAGHTVFARN